MDWIQGKWKDRWRNIKILPLLFSLTYLFFFQECRETGHKTDFANKPTGWWLCLLMMLYPAFLRFLIQPSSLYRYDMLPYLIKYLDNTLVKGRWPYPGLFFNRRILISYSSSCIHFSQDSPISVFSNMRNHWFQDDWLSRMHYVLFYSRRRAPFHRVRILLNNRFNDRIFHMDLERWEYSRMDFISSSKYILSSAWTASMSLQYNFNKRSVSVKLNGICFV